MALFGITEESTNNSSIQLRIGVIGKADPIRNLYYIFATQQLDLGIPDIGVPLEVYKRSNKGSQVIPTYVVGDFVLFVRDNDERHGEFVFILGTVPSHVLRTEELDEAYLKTFTNGVSLDFIKAMYDAEWDFIQQPWKYTESGDITFQGKTRLDKVSGDYTIDAKESALSVSDYSIRLNTDKSRVYLDSVTGALITSAIVEKNYTVCTDNCIGLIDGYTNNSYSVDIKTVNEEDISQDNKFLSESAGILQTGKTSVILNNGYPLSKIEQSINGAVSIKSASCLTFEKTIDIDNYRVSDKVCSPVIYTEQIKKLVDSSEDYESYKEGLSDLSSKDSSVVVKDSLLKKTGVSNIDLADLPNSNTGENLNVQTSKVSDILFGYSNEYVQNKAKIQLMPNGGILLQDAWGSEIRMEGGNIQISAANNIINISGRDNLSITGGVHTVSAAGEVQIASKARDVVIAAGRRLKLKAVQDISVIANKLYEIVKETVFTGCTSIIRKASKNIQIAAANILNLAGSKTTVYGEAGTGLYTPSSSVLVNSRGVHIAGTENTVHGSLHISKKSFKVNNVMTQNMKFITIDNSQNNVMFSVDGTSSFGELARFGESVLITGALSASAVSHSAGKEIGTCSRPVFTFTAKGSAVSETLTSNEDAKKAEDKIKEDKIDKIYTIQSNGCCIVQPLFSYIGKVTESVVPIVDSEDDSMYIYPGKDFWEASGMRLYTEPSEVYKEQKISYVSVKDLKLNSKSYQEV